MSEPVANAKNWRRWGVVAWPLLPLMTSLVGCGSRVEATVSGVVKLDGARLDHGQVVFVPVAGSGGQGAVGQIQSDGSYSIQVARTGGLPPGKYGVTVSSREPSKSSQSGGPPSPGKLLTPKRYSRADTTDLLVEVRPGGNSIDLDLVSK